MRLTGSTRRAAGAALTALLSLGALPICAQVDPNDPLGLGVKRGIQTLNGSGQVGTVTLFRRGSKTFIDVSVAGVPGGHVERVGIHRNRDCDDPPGAAVAYALSDLVRGRSRTLVVASEARLLSGNYSVIVSTKEKTPRNVACGHLFT